MFQNTAFFSGGLGDPPILAAIKNLPQGLHTAYRYNKDYPVLPENKAFANAFEKVAQHEATNWGWQNYVAANFIFEAVRRTGGKTDSGALAKEIGGMKLKTPFGSMTMREGDHTLINYPVAWGKTIAKSPWVIDHVDTEWSKIVELELQWKKSKGYA